MSATITSAPAPLASRNEDDADPADRPNIGNGD
jgi:hypothetical protein